MPVFNPTTVVGTSDQVLANGNVGTNEAGAVTLTLAPNTVVPGTEGMTVPGGTTAQRPSVPLNGEIRYNSTLGNVEVYQDGQWFKVGVTRVGTKGIIAIYNGSIGAFSGTSTIPFDNTAPLVTEGTEIFSTASSPITPHSINSTFKIHVPMTIDCSTSNRVVIAALFRTVLGVTTCINTAVWFTTGGGRPTTMTLGYEDSPATTNPITYSLRVGIGAGSGTWYVNSTSSGNNLGGTLPSHYEIKEIEI